MLKKVLSFLTVICVGAMVLSIIMIAKEMSDRQKEINDFNELADLITDVTVSDTKDYVDELENSETDDVIGEENSEEDKKTDSIVVTRNLTPLFDRNADCIGWVYIDGTTVNYPVMHTPSEPQRYLRKNFDKEYSIAGIPFVDGVCTLDCDNLIIFGHNMKNGTMFSDITQYQNEGYFSEHPVIEFETAQGLKQYTVFAVVQVKSKDSWYGFHIADDETQYNAKVAEIKSRALYDTGIVPEYPAQLLTLSTCEGVNQNDRIIIIAVERPME